MLAEEKPNKERKRSNKSIAEGLGKLFNFIKIYIWQRNHQLDKSVVSLKAFLTFSDPVSL